MWRPVSFPRLTNQCLISVLGTVDIPKGLWGNPCLEPPACPLVSSLRGREISVRDFSLAIGVPWRAVLYDEEGFSRLLFSTTSRHLLN
jgi:hypothetical protein